MNAYAKYFFSAVSVIKAPYRRMTVECIRYSLWEQLVCVPLSKENSEIMGIVQCIKIYVCPSFWSNQRTIAVFGYIGCCLCQRRLYSSRLPFP